MSTAVPSRPTTYAGPEVWARLWAHRPSEVKDRALLNRELRNPRWALTVDQLESAFGSVRGLRTIELGSGRGDLSALLAQHGAKVTLFDRSEAALREARWRFDRLGLDARYETGDLLASLDPWSARYDVAISLGVIEHFRGRDRSRVIAAHREVLKPGGLAVISVPNARCPPYRLWKLYLELRQWWPYGMELPYTRSELTRRALETGLDPLRVHGLGFWQSIGDHWIKRLFGRGPDWVAKPSRLDEAMGFALLMFARRPASVQAVDRKIEGWRRTWV